MLIKILFPAALLFAITPFAVAAEQASNCRLKGGSMVWLAPDACVMEGGAVDSETNKRGQARNNFQVFAVLLTWCKLTAISSTWGRHAYRQYS